MFLLGCLECLAIDYQKNISIPFFPINTHKSEITLLNHGPLISCMTLRWSKIIGYKQCSSKENSTRRIFMQNIFFLPHYLTFKWEKWKSITQVWKVIIIASIPSFQVFDVSRCISHNKVPEAKKEARHFEKIKRERIKCSGSLSCRAHLNRATKN